MRIHRLKTLETYFNLSRQGVKPYEIRENDRLYQRGDIVELYNIKKNFSGIPEIRTMAGAWAPWPLDSFTKQPLSLDMFETDFLHSLECLTARISFVLPGNDKIGLFDDYVILSLEVEAYRGQDWPVGRIIDNYKNNHWQTVESAEDFKRILDTKPAVETAIPAGVYFVRELEKFFDEADGVAKGTFFDESYRYERSRFPIKSLKDHNAIVESRKGINRRKIMERCKENSTGVPPGIVWNTDEHGFYNINGSPMPKGFLATWLSRKDEFPQTSNAVDPKPIDTPVEDVRCIPSDIFWDELNDKFCYSSGKFLSDTFQNEWHNRYTEFPIYTAPKYDAKGRPKA